MSPVSQLIDTVKVDKAVQKALALMDGVFDPEALARNDREFDWEFKRIPRLKESSGAVGWYTRWGPLVTVSVDSGLEFIEARITTAHEIGHHFLHRENDPCSMHRRDLDLIEAEAELFAFLILSVGQFDD